MRPTASTMLQQNNNNNYPCLSVSGSPRDVLQKCSRASLPFPSRLELGLGDLPLIRGLRAWALCSKSRRKPAGLLGGGRAPTAAPPAGGSTSCPRPADVYLSGEWGRMGYGLPLGLDAGQAGIGALVTVASLKTSEGGGKTQTQCLFLRTEKGSCLYSTAKPGSGVGGGWLRGKTGSRDAPAGGRDGGPAPPVQAGANRARVRSGRRWRKSCGVGRERDPAGGVSLEERQEERDKGGPDGRRVKQERRESPRCCRSSSPRACASCGRRAARRGSREEKGMKKERQRTEEQEEEKGGLGCDGEETRGAEEELKTQSSRHEEEVNSEATTENNDLPDDFTSRHDGDSEDGKQSEASRDDLNRFSDREEANGDSEEVIPAESCTFNAEPETFYGRKDEEGRGDEQGFCRSELNCASDVNNTVNEGEDALTFFKNAEAGAPSSPLGLEEPSGSDDDPSASPPLSPANPAPSLPPLGAMATGLEAGEEEEEEEEEGAGDGEGGQRGKRRELEEPGDEERGSTVATEEGRKEEEEEEEEEEDEFGVFMQADGEPAWSEGSTMSASVPCGSRESVALGHRAVPGESTHWTPGWTDTSLHQPDDTWTAFPQDSSDERRDAAGQWWPTSAAEERRDGLSANQDLASLFAEAFPFPFPSPPAPSSGDPRDLDTVPTLTQLLGGGAGQDQGLLDRFHDLNKMICQRYKRANVVSRDLLLKTLHLQPPHAESRAAPRSASRRHSPGLPSANQHAQNAAAKRRLSYDYNRNIVE